MKNIVKQAVVGVVMMACSFTANAQKIAHVNLDSLISIMPESKVAQQGVQAYAKQLEQQVTAMQTELQTKYAEFQEKSKDLADILSKLNLGQYKPVKEVPLHHSNKPETLFAGFYNDNLLIVHPDLPFAFFSDTQSDTEKLFIDTFPDSEIAAKFPKGFQRIKNYLRMTPQPNK